MTSSVLRTTVCAALVLGAIPRVSATPNPGTSMHGSPIRLSQQQRAHVLDGDYTLLHRVADLSPSVKFAFASGHFEMADPGQEYQVTDVVRPGTHLPWRRLVLAGCLKSRCFIHYEKGGIGHAYYVVVFDVTAESASFLWGGAGFKGASDLAALRSKVRSGEFDDTMPYYW